MYKRKKPTSSQKRKILFLQREPEKNVRGIVYRSAKVDNVMRVYGW